jgi:hypothetical protein
VSKEMDEINTLCPCGRKGRYTSRDENGDFLNSCNKYKRCLTHDELEKKLRITSLQLSAYQNTVNKIDDFFEYSSESLSDKKMIYKLIGLLTDSLRNIK